jgi:hypothetical protein
MRGVTTAVLAVLAGACGGEVSLPQPAAPATVSLVANVPTAPSVAHARAEVVVPVEVVNAASTCSPDAAWNGSSCAPKVACAAGATWNGWWCLDSTIERTLAAKFGKLDEDIRLHFAPEASGYEYAGTVMDVVGRTDTAGHVTPGRYQQDVADADHRKAQLDAFIKECASPYWRAAAFARQGMLYDEVWTALENADAPRIALLTLQQEQLLARLTGPGPLQLQNHASDLRAAVADAWRGNREAKLAEVGKDAVSAYAVAVALARAYGVTNPQVTHAEDRLAAFMTALGENTMRGYVTQTLDPLDPSRHTTLSYKPGMYRRPSRFCTGACSTATSASPASTLPRSWRSSSTSTHHGCAPSSGSCSSSRVRGRWS